MDDALHGRPADRTRSFVFTVDRHCVVERGHLVGKRGARFLAQAGRPFRQNGAAGREQLVGLGVGQVLALFEWGEAGAEQDFVAVGVADAGEDALVGQRALERVRRGAQACEERVVVDVEDFQSAGVEGCQRGAALDQAKGRAFLLARLGQDHAAGCEVERGQAVALGHRLARGVPAQPAGDHQVQHGEEIVGEFDDDLFGDSADADDLAAREFVYPRRDGAEQERAGQSDAGEPMSAHPLVQTFDVHGQVGQFGHGRLG